MPPPPDSAGIAASEPLEPLGPRPIGRNLALVLALLLALALVAWTVIPRHQVEGRITWMDGQMALTGTHWVTGCDPWTNGTQGGDRYATFDYELANLGDSAASITVIIASTTNGLEVVAEHPYTLGPHVTVEGTISASVPYLGSCPSTPLALGTSSLGSA